SDGIDIQQAAMLRINPATALLLLTDIVPLKPGDWVIQNVANSAVGRLVIRLARPRGVKTVNVVRRESLFGELKALGADVCVIDGPDLAEVVKTQTHGAPIRLGLDAVSGRATARLSACLAEGGVVCNYGSMTSEDPVMSRSALISGGLSLVGFILGRGLATRSLDQIRAIYADLGQQVAKGNLSAPIERIYPIEDITEAAGRFTKAALRDPDNADLQNYLGYSYRNLGQLDRAFQHYKRALELNPRHRGAHEYAGEAYLMVGDLARAEEHLAALRKICLI